MGVVPDGLPARGSEALPSRLRWLYQQVAERSIRLVARLLAEQAVALSRLAAAADQPEVAEAAAGLAAVAEQPRPDLDDLWRLDEALAALADRLAGRLQAERERLSGWLERHQALLTELERLAAAPWEPAVRQAEAVERHLRAASERFDAAWEELSAARQQPERLRALLLERVLELPQLAAWWGELVAAQRAAMAAPWQAALAAAQVPWAPPQLAPASLEPAVEAFVSAIAWERRRQGVVRSFLRALGNDPFRRELTDEVHAGLVAARERLLGALEADQAAWREALALSAREALVAHLTAQAGPQPHLRRRQIDEQLAALHSWRQALSAIALPTAMRSLWAQVLQAGRRGRSC